MVKSMSLKKITTFSTIFYIFSSIIVPQADAAWNVWLDHAIKKYRQGGEDGTSGSQSHSMKIAKNEFESFQVFVYANGQVLNDVDIVVSNFTKGADVIDDIYIYKEHYVNCILNSRVEYETGYYPDALLPKVDRFYNEPRSTFPVDVSTSKVQGFWIDVGTETTTVPGIYTATVTISAEGMVNEQLPVTLEVFDFALPSTSSFPANYVMRANALSYGHGYELNYNNSPAKEIISKYMEMFLYHKTTPVIRGDGASMTYTWEDGTKTLTLTNYAPWEDWISPGMNGTAITIGPYNGAKFPVQHVVNRDNPDTDGRIADADKQSATRQYLQQTYDRFASNDWDPINTLYNTVVDEPHCDTYQDWRGQRVTMCERAYAQALDSAAIDTHGAGTFDNVSVHSIITKAGMTDFEQYGFYSPNIATLACANWDRDCTPNQPSGGTREDYKDTPYWSYLGCSSNGCRIICDESCSNQVDSSIDAVAMYNRAASFFRYMTRATGSWYWAVSDLNFTNSPYNNAWSAEYSSNADGHLLYAGIVTKTGRTWNQFSGLGGGSIGIPELGGTHDIPIASMRWKYIRDQQEDLEYFKLAEEQSGRDTVLTTIGPVFNNEFETKLAYWALNMSPDVLLTTRANIAGLITGSSSPTPLTININTPIVE